MLEKCGSKGCFVPAQFQNNTFLNVFCIQLKTCMVQPSVPSCWNWNLRFVGFHREIVDMSHPQTVNSTVVHPNLIQFMSFIGKNPLERLDEK